jgi:hypothetical protein
MIILRRVVIRFLLLFLLLLSFNRVGQSVVAPLKPGEIWLEIPEASTRVEANTSAELSTAPLTYLKLHIAKSSSDIDYGSIHTRINTEASDTLMTTTGTEDGILCNLDLKHLGGSPLTPGRNSLEINYMDHFNRLHYASFLLDRGAPSTSRKLAATGPPLKITGQKYAVVVGVARYKNAGAGLKDLRYADKDAADFRDFLQSPAGGSFPSDNILMLLNESATSEALRSALFTFLSKPHPDDLVVIYLAGHGSPDPNDSRNLYFLTYDTEVDNMGGTAFLMSELGDVFDRVLKAHRVITFVDSCHSFGVSGARNLGVPQNNLVNQYVQRFASNGERAVLTASDTSEYSFEDAKWGGGHGVFTYYLLQGLKQDADSNHDGTVTVAELSNYLRDKVTTDTAGKQNPQAIMGKDGNIPVSTVPRQLASLTPKLPVTH